LELDLTGADAKTLTRNRGKYLAVDPGRGRLLSSFGHDPDTSSEPARLATYLAATVALYDPAAQCDLAHAHSASFGCVEHGFTQTPVKHDRTRAKTVKFATQASHEHAPIVLVGRNGSLGQLTHRLVALERCDDIAQPDLFSVGTIALGRAPTPAQLGSRALTGEPSKTIDTACLIVQRRFPWVVKLGTILMCALSERGNLEVLCLNTPTPMSVRVLQVVMADKRSVLVRLVGREVGDEPAIAAGGGISVEHQHTASVTGKHEQLTRTAVCIEVPGERTGRADR
jgi:hypothetical protein